MVVAQQAGKARYSAQRASQFVRNAVAEGFFQFTVGILQLLRSASAHHDPGTGVCSSPEGRRARGKSRAFPFAPQYGWGRYTLSCVLATFALPCAAKDAESLFFYQCASSPPISCNNSAVRERISASLPRLSTFKRISGSVLDERRLKRQSPRSMERPSVKSTALAPG
jgi:hypothetical protein